jgi:uncharacterized protein YutE (UPF0331/DUF86 family)
LRDAATDALIERKLVLLVGYADELRPLVEGSASGGPAVSNVTRRAIERLVQLLVEVAADGNGLIVAARGGTPPVTARESFVAVRDLGVLPHALAERFIASYVGLRNRVVHDYDTLDHRLVRQAARRLAADAVAYARRVRRWLAAPRE